MLVLPLLLVMMMMMMMFMSMPLVKVVVMISRYNGVNVFIVFNVAIVVVPDVCMCMCWCCRCWQDVFRVNGGRAGGDQSPDARKKRDKTGDINIPQFEGGDECCNSCTLHVFARFEQEDQER